MKSSKKHSIDVDLIEFVEGFGLCGKVTDVLKMLLASKEIQANQEFANSVSIVRLGYNDHGPVHMRIVTKNAVVMMELLKKAGIKTSLENDKCGSYEESLIAVIFAAFLHDIGMGMGRPNHDLHSTILAQPIIDKILEEVYKDDWKKRVMIRDIALEGIAGHMGANKVSSLEAGIVQVADGCDMTKGRARIPISMGNVHKTGYIHQYSANSIEVVDIKEGTEKPLRIDVIMSNEVGIFQVEEVLLHKIANSTAKQYIELYAQVGDEQTKRYL